MLEGNNAQKTVESPAQPVPNLRKQVFEFLQKKGPSVPVTIAEGVKRESFFVGAVLSELFESKKVLLSHAKIGGSRVYYIKGQEEQLSVLFNYLPEAEKRAYTLLKEKNVIRASETEPVIRVALSNLKDFARPVAVGSEPGWRWHLYQEIVEAKPVVKQPVIVKKQEPLPVQEEQKTIQPKAKKAPKVDVFGDTVQQYLSQQNITLHEREVVRKNSECTGIVTITSQLGPLSLFVCGKNKKKINDQDLVLAYQKGKDKKMPTLLLTTGELTKKAQEYLVKNLKGYVIVRKL